LPAATCEALGYAFREMLNNAIEHGCKLDPQLSSPAPAERNVYRYEMY
jgi:hypothetical protein